ncbi:MAG: hypothetical protein H9W81_18420 [Enterococcus sp.]|nr:hypothetical protein [Enterococcus sp.]
MNFYEYRQLKKAVEDYKTEALERAIQYIKSVRGVFHIVIGQKPSEYSASFGKRIWVADGEVLVSLVTNNNISSIEAGVPLRAVEIVAGDLQALQQNEEKLAKFRREFITLAKTYAADGRLTGIPEGAGLFLYDDHKIGIIEDQGISYQVIPQFLLDENVPL